jgi:DNA-binding NarL/FixJ family response regulator
MTDMAKAGSKIRVALVEDNAETRRTWAALLDAHPRVQCVAACESAEAALQQIPAAQPEVIWMDINLPGMSGIHCTSRLKERLPTAQILILTAYSHDRYILDALKAGASGYLLKSLSSAQLIRSILEVVEGGAPMTGQIARRVIAVFREPTAPGSKPSELTARENEILGLLAQGYTNQEIATALNCSAGTMKVHLEHIHAKLHVHCRAGATAKYLSGPVQGQTAAGQRRPSPSRPAHPAGQ